MLGRVGRHRPWLLDVSEVPRLPGAPGLRRSTLPTAVIASGRSTPRARHRAARGLTPAGARMGGTRSFACPAYSDGSPLFAGHLESRSKRYRLGVQVRRVRRFSFLEPLAGSGTSRSLAHDGRRAAKAMEGSEQPIGARQPRSAATHPCIPRTLPFLG